MAGLLGNPGLLVPVSLAAVFLVFFSGSLNTVLLVSVALSRHRKLLADSVGPDFLPSAAKIAGGSIFGFLVFQLFRLTWTALETPKWNGPGKVYLFPARTTHSRMFPKKHSFSYSYLVVGIPVGWEGNAGGMISSGAKSESGLSSWFSLTPRLRKGWYNVDAGDYLERGNSERGLRGKLDDYLRAEVGLGVFFVR